MWFERTLCNAYWLLNYLLNFLDDLFLDFNHFHYFLVHLVSDLDVDWHTTVDRILFYFYGLFVRFHFYDVDLFFLFWDHVSSDTFFFYDWTIVLCGSGPYAVLGPVSDVI